MIWQQRNKRAIFLILFVLLSAKLWCVDESSLVLNPLIQSSSITRVYPSKNYETFDIFFKTASLEKDLFTYNISYGKNFKRLYLCLGQDYFSSTYYKESSSIISVSAPVGGARVGASFQKLFTSQDNSYQKYNLGMSYKKLEFSVVNIDNPIYGLDFLLFDFADRQLLVGIDKRQKYEFKLATSHWLTEQTVVYFDFYTYPETLNFGLQKSFSPLKILYLISHRRTIKPTHLFSVFIKL